MRPYLIAGLFALVGGSVWFGLAGPVLSPRPASVAGRAEQAPLPVLSPAVVRMSPSIASLPDRGNLVAFDRLTPPRRASAYTWYPVSLSEAHAIRAVATGEMDITAPDGQLIRLKYARHVEHRDGNWTWIGRPEGAKPGIEAIITFGEKAVFGTIPSGTHPLRLTTGAGRTWMMETDGARLATLDNLGAHPRDPDVVLPPAPRRHASGAATAGAQALPTSPAATTAAAATAANTVDLLLGYTATFAQRLGGQSQAVTRLTNMVDIANQAYANSQIAAQVRLVGTLQVNYPDATSNKTALFELTGCTEANCDSPPIPASLQPLHDAREQYGADLVSLVRNFNDPEQGGCGIAWVIGGEQLQITVADEYAGMSVVSDSNGIGNDSFPDNGYVCRDETLAHELAHNMGSAHDRATAADTDDSNADGNLLDPNEYGHTPYSFGYRTGGAANFFTVMAYRESGTNQVQNRVFSNPQISTCGPTVNSQIYPCGDAGADNARNLRETIPTIASFRAAVPPIPDSDFNGDGVSDVWWRNSGNGVNVVWLSANIATAQTMTGVALAWKIVGIGDFDGDERSDVLWRNESTGGNVIWRSGNASTPTAMAGVPGTAWKVMGVADFDGDGRSDILWRNESIGANRIWKSGNANTLVPVSNLASSTWKVVGVGDFEGDGVADIVWRNNSNGANVIWRNGNAATPRAMSTIADLAWQVVGVGDFDADARDDILWRHAGNGINAIWRSGQANTPKAVSGVALAWSVGCVADFDGDAAADILWRNANGSNVIWRAANSATPQAMAVAATAWQVNC